MRISTKPLGLAVIAAAACSTGAPVQSTMRSAAVNAAAPVVQPVAVMSSEPRELLPDEQVQQVLNRLSFGPRPGEAETVRAMGVDKWIAMQLTPERIDDRAADQLVSQYQTLNESIPDLVQTFREVQQARRREQMQLKAEGDTASKRDARREALAENPQLRE